MIDKFLAVPEELESFNRLTERLIRENTIAKTTALTTGVVDSQKCHFACSLAVKLDRPLVFIAASEVKAREILTDAEFFFPGRTVYYPVKDIIFYSADVKSANITRSRFEILHALMGETKPKAVVLSVEALFDRLTAPDIFKDFIKEFRTGGQLIAEELPETLLSMGYERADMVEGPGQFAIRGGIIDIFSVTEERPIRIEMWGDVIDSMRYVDPMTQRSVDKADNVLTFPARELVFSHKETQRAQSLIESEYKSAYDKYVKQGLTEEAQTLRDTITDALRKLKDGLPFNGVDKYAGYFYKDKTTLLDYLPEDSIVFFDEPARVAQAAEGKFKEFEESFKNRIEKGTLLPGMMDSTVSYQEILSRSKAFSQVLMSTMASTSAAAGFTPEIILNFTVKSGTAVPNRIDLLMDDLKYLAGQNYRVLILAGGRTRGERLAKELADEGFSCAFYNDNEELDLIPGMVTLAAGTLSKGFEYPQIKFRVIAGGDIFGGGKAKKPGRKSRENRQAISFADLTIGDYVVHDIHGIGVYRGIEKISADGISRDYLKISYSDGGSLFINTAQMDALQKYIGGEEAKPKLNKLGGQEFSKAKARVRAAVKEMAGELTELYAKRESAKGYTYSSDTVWQKEFEEGFPYDETDDQLQAIADVKTDMESGKVMDRLVCGDVGYGKTEVAIRAAFKAVVDGKQVVYLVPTTILAQQHYNTFIQRMKDFPVSVDLMSRFRSDKQQRETARGLASGAVDVVIGTHRLLSKDIKFKDLGLIVVDEEQRFGVGHKERLKKLRENVNVLTLTATPIPRTLHMSLTGIRDMSVLGEPPLERIPVQTYVMEYDPESVRDAIYRELTRGGQVYYLHNRVRNIHEVAARIAKLAPDATVAYAHGQMSERELENVMMDFIEGEIDVLVCTTIIESGLDIQNVNTIIIQDADYLGLAQLYQLRGRVGRSNRIAYCYLMYRKDKVLTEASEKRLQIIKAFTEFGAGFKIAMRDLSMRGAGNILGAEQHGHMDAVGYEMYLRLLDEAVRTHRTGEVIRDFETLIDVPVNAYIPESYIPDEGQKLDVYRRIAQVMDEEGYLDVQDELIDRFGDVPLCVQNLLNIALLKAAARKLDAVSVVQKGGNLVVTFPPDARVSPDKLAECIKRYEGKLMFAAALNPSLVYKGGDINGLRKALAEMR